MFNVVISFFFPFCLYFLICFYYVVIAESENGQKSSANPNDTAAKGKYDESKKAVDDGIY
jgi:hypothetical protein